jgi:hypothetical protein
MIMRRRRNKILSTQLERAKKEKETKLRNLKEGTEKAAYKPLDYAPYVPQSIYSGYSYSMPMPMMQPQSQDNIIMKLLDKLNAPSHRNDQIDNKLVDKIMKLENDNEKIEKKITARKLRNQLKMQQNSEQKHLQNMSMPFMNHIPNMMNMLAMNPLMRKLLTKSKLKYSLPKPSKKAKTSF